MKKLKIEVLVKFLVVFLVLAGFLISGKTIYDNFQKATKINLSLVETYRPYLDVGLVKKAAGLLQAKSNQFKEERKEEPTEAPIIEESEEASPEGESES